MIMQWLGTAFNGFTLRATDGTIGELADLLFDAKTWHVRWLVVDTGKWLSGRKILIHPSSLQQPECETATLRVHLTRSQIRNSPFIENDADISLQMERSLTAYYGYDPDANGAWCRTESIMNPPDVPSSRRRKLLEPHLRSVAEVEGYLIRASDGESGFLKNVVVDDEAWRVLDLVIDVPTWWSMKHVVVQTSSVERISWSERCIRLDLTRRDIRNSVSLCQTVMLGSPYSVLLRAYRAWKTQGPSAAGGAWRA
jgi:hypothetical protein